MTKEQLAEIVKRLLETNADLDFLSKSSKSELETLVAAVKDRVETKADQRRPLSAFREPQKTI